VTSFYPLDEQSVGVILTSSGLNHIRVYGSLARYQARCWRSSSFWQFRPWSLLPCPDIEEGVEVWVGDTEADGENDNEEKAHNHCCKAVDLSSCCCDAGGLRGVCIVEVLARQEAEAHKLSQWVEDACDVALCATLVSSPYQREHDNDLSYLQYASIPAWQAKKRCQPSHRL